MRSLRNWIVIAITVFFLGLILRVYAIWCFFIIIITNPCLFFHG